MSELFDPSLEHALKVERVGDHLFEKNFPDGWQQGRGAFGGIVLGSMCRAMEATETDLSRVLRSFTGEIFAPVLPGQASIAIEVLRVGAGVSTYRSTLIQSGAPVAVGVGVFGKNRNDSGAWNDLSKPSFTPHWSELPPLPIEPPIGPHFARAFDFRSTGPLPFSGAKEQIANGWVRPKAPTAKLGASELIVMADTFWPSGFSTMDAPRPMATLTFTFQHFPSATVLDPSEPLFYCAKTVAGHGGYVSEMRELWTARGELLALNPQTFVHIK